MARRALATVNVAAIERNVQALRAAAPAAALAAVVKADGYGHGAAAAARAAQAGGATWLAVATAGEATALRGDGLTGPVLVLGALSPDELVQALDADADVVVWREDMVAEAAAAADPGRPARLHVKHDTGMGRLGTRDPEEALRTVEAVLATPGVELVGAMTHFATADDRQDPHDFFGQQLDRFTAWAQRVRAIAPGVVVHAANSAALLREDASHFDLVRPGVAIYGLDPFGTDPAPHGLEPALALASYVAEIKPAHAGESAGYGRGFVALDRTDIATIPIGYGDGWHRAAAPGDVLVRGRHRPIVGRISMDNVTVSLGLNVDVERGDEVLLLGTQGDARILAEEVARHAGTINYEVTCALTARVPRIYHRDGEPLA